MLRRSWIPKENIFILASGNVLELDEYSAAVTGSVHTGAILVDGLGVGDVGNIVLRDRQHLAEDGIMIVVMTLERHSNVVLAGPDIVSRGFVYVRESEELMDEAKCVLDDTMERLTDNNVTDWGKIKTEVKDALGDFVWKETKRRPMIIPIIMEGISFVGCNKWRWSGCTRSGGKGHSAEELGQLLEDKGLVRDHNLFYLQLKLSAYSGHIKPGIYTLNTSMTAKDMMVIMSSDKSDERTDTDYGAFGYTVIIR